MSFSIPHYSKDIIAREASKILLETEAIKVDTKNPFTYTSGRVGPTYVDCRKLIAFPNARGMLMDMATSLLLQEVGSDLWMLLPGGKQPEYPMPLFYRNA